MTTMLQYPVFVDNQVLTKDQLNDLFRYLDQQNRLSTNVALIGIGIVCGLEVTQQDDPEAIVISGGVGVTSLGYVIKLKNCVTVSHRVYELPEGLEYDPLMDGDAQDIFPLELLTEDERDAAIETGDTVEDLVPDELEDMIVMLFIECIDHEKQSCLGKSCDELGVDRILNIRKLLLTEEQVNTILERTNGGFTNAEKLVWDWQKVSMPRVHFSGDDDVHYLQFVLAYLEAVMSVRDKVYATLESTYTGWETLYQPVYGGNPFLTSAVLTVRNQIDAFLAGGVMPVPFLGVQYLYDYFKELIHAYDEYVQAACGFISECCPDTSLFEKHLFLGRVGLPADSTDYRHRFTASPAHDHENNSRRALIRLHRRLVELCSAFSFDLMLKEDIDETKITPSKEKREPLSDRAIPHYYHIESLEQLWQRSDCRNKYLLSYARNDFHSAPDDPESTPMHFDIDPYNFFRVEGMLGQHVDEVEAYLQDVRVKYNAPMNIETVYLGTANGDIDIPDCILTDLQADYSDWRNKTLYVLRTLMMLLPTARSVVLRSDKYRDSVTGSTGAKKKMADDSTAGPDEGISAMNKAFGRYFNTGQAAYLFSLRDEWDSIEKETSFSPAEVTSASPQSMLAAQIEGYRSCLLDLIKSMKADLRHFSFDTWKSKYKCLLEFNINMMKLAVAYTRDMQQMRTVYILLLYYCILYKIIAFLAIYPYLGLGSLMDILEARIAEFKAHRSLGRFNKNHPGLEHKAGVGSGGTLVLLYQSVYSREGITEEDLAKYLEMGVDLNDVFKRIGEGLEHRVVGDFAIPYTCCDPCGRMENTGRELSPLAVPICGVVRVRTRGSYDLASHGETMYAPLRLRILPHAYDVSTFAIRLSPISAANTGPRYGQTELLERPARENPDEKVQHLMYSVDFELLNQANVVLGEDFFVIDEFDYQVVDKVTGEIVDDSSIHIFIPIVARGKGTVGIIEGQVVDVQGAGIPAVSVGLQGTTHATVTDAGGRFVMGGVPVGSYVIRVDSLGYDHKGQEINVVEGRTEVTLRADVHDPNAGISGFKATEKLRTNLDIVENSAEDRLLRKQFLRKFNNTEKVAEELEAKAKKLNDPVSEKALTHVKELTATEPVNITAVNRNFVKERDTLLKEARGADGERLELINDTLELMTIAYLDRVALEQPGKPTAKTSEVIETTAKSIAKTDNAKFKKAYERWEKETSERLSGEMQEVLNKNFRT